MKVNFHWIGKLNAHWTWVMKINSRARWFNSIRPQSLNWPQLQRRVSCCARLTFSSNASSCSLLFTLSGPHSLALSGHWASLLLLSTSFYARPKFSSSLRKRRRATSWLDWLLLSRRRLLNCIHTHTSTNTNTHSSNERDATTSQSELLRTKLKVRRARKFISSHFLWTVTKRNETRRE